MPENSTLFLPPLDTITFLDDSLSAYAALESQLHVSVVTAPDATARDRLDIIQDHENEDDDSIWPEDLDQGHSDERTKLDQSGQRITDGTLVAGRDSSPDRAEQGVPAQSVVAAAQTINHFPKPRTKATINKPFKLPLKRAASDVIGKPSQGSPRRYVSRSQSEAFSQSSYLKSPILDRSAKRGRLEVTREEDTTPRNVSSKTPPNAGDIFGGDGTRSPPTPQIHLPPGQRTSPQSHESNQDVTSELPTTYDLSDITSESSRPRLRGSQRSNSDPGPEIGGKQLTQSSGRSNSQPPSPVKLRKPLPTPKQLNAKARAAQSFSKPIALVSDLPVAQAPAALPVTTSVAAAVAKRHPIEPTLPALPTVNLCDLPPSVRPPEPGVSLSPFTTNVTPLLASLVAPESKITASYHPIAVTRELRPLERGYWLLVTPSEAKWPMAARVACWQYLTKVVESGGAGWGIWCTRNDNPRGIVDWSEDAGQGCEIRVYCWGEVVRHVYLLLYVASHSKVRKLGMTWVDAEGEVVVRMTGPGIVPG